MFAALLLVAVVTANYRVVFFGETFGLRDFAVFGYPLAAHLQESLRAGELPLWNILSECGHPFLGQWNTMVLYPFMLLAVLFPLGPALAVFCLVHQFAGGLGMYFLARRWSRSGPAGAVAGILYAFDGIMQTSLMWPNNMAALGLLPWVILAVQTAWQRGGRAVLGAALLATLQLLTGAPEMIITTWLFAFLAMGHEWAKREAGPERRRMWWRCGAVVGLAALLAAVQLIPFFDLLIHSSRAEFGGRTTSFVHWYSWANFFLPLFENIGQEPYGGTMHFSQFWTHSYFLGYVPWLLLGPALFRNRDDFPRNLGACCLFALILALGPDGRLYGWVGKVVPLELMRFPVKFLVFCKVAMPLLAAWGIRRMSIPGNHRVLWWSLAMIGGLFGVAFWLQFNIRLPREGESFARADVPIRVGWFFAIVVAVVLTGRLRWQRRRLAWLGVAALVCVNLLRHQPALSPTVHPGVYTMELEAGGLLKTARHPHARALPSQQAVNDQVYGPLRELPRMVPEVRTWLAHNANLIDQVPLVGGFYALHLPRYRMLYFDLFSDFQGLNETLVDFVGATHTTEGSDRYRWVNRTNAQPLVTVGRKPVFLERDPTVNHLVGGKFKPAAEVLLEPANADAIGLQGVSEATVAVVRHDPHCLEFVVNTPAPTVATVAQTHYHWWKAELDDSPTEIEYANFAFQGVVVPAGEHRVVLRYVDQGFRVGLLISVVTLIGVAVGWWRFRNRGASPGLVAG